MSHPISTFILFVSLSVLLGCTSAIQTPIEIAASPQFERGRPNAVIDTVGNVVAIPRKLLMWDRRVDNHNVSKWTEQELREYVAANELHGTKVRLNQYAPIEEWHRLADNRSIPALSRYTLGTLHMIEYTLHPGRIFGGDSYNPYTNTLNVYSDISSLGMVEVAYAKDLRERQHPGWYALGQELPVVGMIHETKATNDVLAYLEQHPDTERNQEALKVLEPRYWSQFGGEVAEFIPQASAPLTIGGGIYGHISGRSKAKNVKTVSHATAPDNDSQYR